MIKENKPLYTLLLLHDVTQSACLSVRCNVNALNAAVVEDSHKHVYFAHTRVRRLYLPPGNTNTDHRFLTRNHSHSKTRLDKHIKNTDLNRKRAFTDCFITSLNKTRVITSVIIAALLRQRFVSHRRGTSWCHFLLPLLQVGMMQEHFILL